MARFEPPNPRFSLRLAGKSPAEPDENSGVNGSDAAASATASSALSHFPPPRTPLNAIADPSVDSFRGLSRRYSSAPGSAQSTPSKNGSRFSVGGATSCRALHPGSSRASKAILAVNSEFCDSPAHFELEDDPSFWSDHNVQVLIRIRPPSAMERISQGYRRCLRQESGQSLVWLGPPETRFTFDHVTCETISQESLFRVAGLHMVENCLSGYNSCMFAFGQTGSGKTYTMMGEIYEIEGKLTDECGLTPRIFEYLFTRITTEEENRREDQLKYSCKCSFLEIYNEHITDLLEPSSANLQLREDLKKGVYVENLTEYEVRNVDDVVNLLLRGAANRKVAATHMNSESSRSHSVFTCTIESSWGKDSMTHLRFARLNLVDLAGSERQKSSGAEGDRLKEAANINKSLSTLGLVIMSLVDLAHGKHRHVPYRDSRLTFLLQDSLGGNSKTTVIANISPSICSANETLSTLKFAQRAKLIQNNAKVNEDSSGDISVLQQQIQELKGQLSYLVKNAYLMRSSPCCEPSREESTYVDLPEEYGFLGIRMKTETHVIQHLQNKIKCMESTLAEALRREKLAETAYQNLEVELEKQNCLANQREAEARHAKTIIKLRDEEIKRLESLKDGVISADEYLALENKALMGEIQILQAEINRNQEIKQCDVENKRLREQLRQFQNFYGHGERDALIAEVSELRNQILDVQVGMVPFPQNNESQENHTTMELEDCKIMNSKLISEVEEIHRELRKNLNYNQSTSDSVLDSFSKDSEIFRQADEFLLFDNRSMQSDAGDTMTFCNQRNDEALHPHMDRNVDGVPSISSNVSDEEFMDALSDRERLSTQENSGRPKESPSILEFNGISRMKHASRFLEPCDFDRKSNGLIKGKSEEIDRIALQAKLDSMAKDLAEVRLLNCQFQEEQKSQLSSQLEAELVRDQVEMETSRTILQLQEEVASLQCTLDKKLGYMAQENAKLRKIVATKDEELKAQNRDWESATLELTGFLVDGSRSIRNISRQIESIAHSFPATSVSINEHVERAAKTYIEKEETILQLKTSLEDAQSMVLDLGQKLTSLKGVTLALTEFQNPSDGEVSNKHLSMFLGDNFDRVQMLETKLKIKEGQVTEAEKCASVALILINWLYDREKVTRGELDSGRKTEELRHQPKRSEYSTDDTLSLETHESLTFAECYGILRQITDEIAKADCRLEVIASFVLAKVDVSECSSTNGGMIHEDEWSPTCSSSSSDFSIGSAVSGKSCHASSCNGGYKTSKLLDLNFKGPFVSFHPNTASRNLSCEETTQNLLKSELETVFEASNKLSSRVAMLINDLSSRRSSDLDDLKQTIGSSGSTLEKANFGSCIHKGVSSEQIEHGRSFLGKFEQVHSTIKEADFMLNALTEANENSKQLSGMWKRAGEELMLEQANLYEEIEHLRLSVRVKENEIQLLQDQASCGLQDIAISVSVLEECYAQLKSGEKHLATVFSDVYSLGMELLQSIRSSRLSLEDVCFKLLEKDFSSFVLRQCYMGELTNKISYQEAETGFHQFRNVSKTENIRSNGCNEIMINGTGFLRNGAQRESDNNKSLLDDNFSLKKELKRKEELLAGLLFDFSLLQESTSSTKDVKDEAEKLVCTLSKVRFELETKTRQYDEISVQHKKLESRLVETEQALAISASNIADSNETVEALSEQNAELRMLCKDLYLKKSEIEEQLEEHKEVVKSLEGEILQLSSSSEKNLISLVEGFEDKMIKLTYEKDQLNDEVQSLNDKLEMTYAIVDEKENIIVEAHEESKASKLYAEQKEEEVKILENSIEELESTIDVLEKKVTEMDEEVKRHRLIRDSLESELDALRYRLSIVENLTENADTNEDVQSQISRQLQIKATDLQRAHVRIKFLEEEREQHESEIKQYKEYINEIMLHAEAQSSQYQKKYKSLEDMVSKANTDSRTSTSAVQGSDRVETSTVRTRGSSSPFRCISSLVPQLNSEREEEISAARLRIEELEALSAGWQKEVCLLKTRLASTDSMTHDVIRDLLGVKLDINNFANIVDQYQVQKLIEDAHQHTEAVKEKEEEVVSLTKQIDDLIEERQRCMNEINMRERELLAAQIDIEQLQERDRILSAHNEMLKMDKTNLMRKIAELDETVKALLGTKSTQLRTQQPSSSKNSLRVGNNSDLAKRLEQSEKLLSRVNGELAQYYKSPCDRAFGHGTVTNSRKQKQKGHDG